MDPLLNQLRDLTRKFGSLSSTLRFGIAAVAALLLLIVVLTQLGGSSGSYEYAFTNLSAEDSSEAAAQLKISLRTIDYWTAGANPRLAYVKFGNEKRFIRGDLRRFIAAHHMNAVELIEQRAAGAQIGQGTGAIGRPGPPVPLHAGVIDAEHDIATGGDEDGGKTNDQKLARRARQSCDPQQQRKRNDDMIRDALLETERAGRKLEHIFEEPGASERRQAEYERRAGRGGGGFGGNPIGPALFHLRCIFALWPSLGHRLPLRDYIE